MFSQQKNNGNVKNNDLIVSPSKTFLEKMEDEEIPPGCEEFQFPSEIQPIIASALKSHSNSALIGLEYIVEVHPDVSYDVNCKAHAFYICVLCEKRCDILDSILKHIESSAHRLFYLRKYFPLAYSLFLQADPCVENWTVEIHEYMEAIISRIESLKGRLQVFPCYRTSWDVKCRNFRNKIEIGIHLRESPDLFYFDVSSPFTAMQLKIQSSNLQLDRSNSVSQSGGIEQISSNIFDIFVKKDSGRRLRQEAIILLSDDSLSETDCDKIDENIFLGTGSQTASKPSLSKIAEQMLCPCLPIKLLYQSVNVNNEEDATNDPAIYFPVSDDDVIFEKEIVAKEIVHKSSNSQQTEKSPTLRSRSRSRSPNRSRFSFGGLDTASRSRSRSPKELHSRYSTRGRNTVPKPQSPSRAPKQLCSRFKSSKQSPKHREQRGSLMRTEQPGQQIRNENHLWKKLEKELNSFKEKIRRKQKIYKKKPERHPLYAVEWNAFWKKRCTELEKEGINPENYDFKPDWFAFWFSRMKKLDKIEIKVKKIELKKKYGLVDDEADQNLCTVNREHTTESLKSRKPVQFGWKNLKIKSESTLNPAQNLETVPYQPKNLNNAEDEMHLPSVVVSSPKSYSFEELRVFQNAKPICHIIENTSQILRDAPLFCKQNLLEILRMLVALEDCLGSLGPSIMNLLTRALSAERCEIGSSSKLMIEDSTCVDLLDTSKEKLKGLLLAGILVGVQRTAALQNVEYVTSFLKQSHTCTPMDGPAGFNMASQINNPHNAELNHPLQCATILRSATGFSSVAEMKGKDSTVSANNLGRFHFEKCDRFSGEELKTLIVNFRTLTPSQKRDLVKYLCQLEEQFPEKDLANQSEAILSSLPSGSPLSKKYRQYKNCKIINLMAPSLPSSKTRYPILLEMTGLSWVDLKNYGIPLEELNSPYRRNEAESIERSPRLGTPKCISVQHKSIDHYFEKRPTDRDEIYVLESISSQQHSFIPPHQCNGSFCYHQLDPRRNRMPRRYDKTIVHYTRNFPL